MGQYRFADAQAIKHVECIRPKLDAVRGLKQGLWQIGGERKVIYAKAELSIPDRLKAVKAKISADEDKARIRAKAKADIGVTKTKKQRNNKNSNNIKLVYE